MPGSRRRAKGEGSILQRADGTWQFSLGLGNDAAGKRQRKYLYASTRGALLRKIADETAKGGGSIRPRAKGTLGEWVERWLRDDVKPNRASNTFAQYETMWRVHAAPIVASSSLEKFGVSQVERLYAELREQGVGSATIQRVGVVLSRAVEVAIRRQSYFKPNPFRLVDKPRHRHKEARSLSVAEAQRFLEHAQGTRYEALWTLLLTTGLRLGEALGLEWKDVDLDRARIAIRQGLVEVNGYAKTGPLKTKSSRRQVELGATAVKALKRRRVTTREEQHGSSFVFTTRTGGHPRRANLRQRYFRPILAAAKIGGMTINALRHSMTSLALAEGVPAKTVAARLGHSTTRLTLDRYGHLMSGADRQAANTLDALLKRASSRD
jgi:integrase